MVQPRRRRAPPSRPIIRARRRARRSRQRVSRRRIRIPRTQLRRIFTLKLATVREDGEPTRRRALRSEFSDEEWRLVSELADHPNRLLVTATPEGGETYAEVAHEAIFRRWDKLREWIAARAGIPGLEKRARSRAPGMASKLRQLEERRTAHGLGAGAGAKLAGQARSRTFPAVDREFIAAAARKEAQRRKRRVQALVYVLAVGIIVGLDRLDQPVLPSRSR